MKEKMINTLTIKHFKKGDKAYSLRMNRGSLSDPTISETEVVSVGKKYVTTTNRHRYENWDLEFLHEHADYGEAELLFKTKENAERYIEKYHLSMWLGNLTVEKAEKFSLDQLQAVKEILQE